MQSKAGARFRLFLFGGTVAVYPIGIILCNGPLLKITFPWRHSVDYQLPDHLKKIINEVFFCIKSSINSLRISKWLYKFMLKDFF